MIKTKLLKLLSEGRKYILYQVIWQWIALLAGIVVGCVLGVLAIRLNRPIVILVTGVAGGFASAKYGADLLMNLFVMDPPTKAMLLVSGAILAAAGLAVQFRNMQEVTGKA